MARIINYLIYLFLFLLPWQTRLIWRPGSINGANWEYGMVGVYGTEILLWIVILLFLFWKVRSSNFRFFLLPSLVFRQKLLVILFIFLLVNIFFVAADKLIAFQQVLHLFSAVAVFFSITKLPLDKVKAATAFLSGLALSASLAGYQFLTQSTFASRWLGLIVHDSAVLGTSVLESGGERWLRAYGPFQHPNILGGYMAVGIIMIVQLLDCSIVKRKTKMFLLIAGCLLSTVLFFSFSRGAWLALFITLSVFLLIYWRRKTIFQASFFPIIACLIFPFSVFCFLFASLWKSRIIAEGRLENQAITERVAGYGEAWQLFKKRPFFGVGLGNYTLAVHKEIDPARPAYSYQPAHNAIVLMTVEIGLSGVVLFGVFMFYLLKIFNIRHSRFAGPSAGRAGRQAISHILFLFFFLSFFDHYLWSLYPGLLLLAAGVGLLTTFSVYNKMAPAP